MYEEKNRKQISRMMRAVGIGMPDESDDDDDDDDDHGVSKPRNARPLMFYSI